MLAAPSLFDQRDDDATVVVLVDAPDDTQLPGARAAAALCPATAITLTASTST